MKLYAPEAGDNGEVWFILAVFGFCAAVLLGGWLIGQIIDRRNRSAYRAYWENLARFDTDGEPLRHPSLRSFDAATEASQKTVRQLDAFARAINEPSDAA